MSKIRNGLKVGCLIAFGAAAGHISIPKLSVDAPILQATGTDVLTEHGVLKDGVFDPQKAKGFVALYEGKSTRDFLKTKNNDVLTIEIYDTYLDYVNQALRLEKRAVHQTSRLEENRSFNRGSSSDEGSISDRRLNSSDEYDRLLRLLDYEKTPRSVLRNLFSLAIRDKIDSPEKRQLLKGMKIYDQEAGVMVSAMRIAGKKAQEKRAVVADSNKSPFQLFVSKFNY